MLLGLGILRPLIALHCFIQSSRPIQPLACKGCSLSRARPGACCLLRCHVSRQLVKMMCLSSEQPRKSRCIKPKVARYLDPNTLIVYLFRQTGKATLQYHMTIEAFRRRVAVDPLSASVQSCANSHSSCTPRKNSAPPITQGTQGLVLPGAAPALRTTHRESQQSRQNSPLHLALLVNGHGWWILTTPLLQTTAITTRA